MKGVLAFEGEEERTVVQAVRELFDQVRVLQAKRHVLAIRLRQLIMSSLHIRLRQLIVSSLYICLCHLIPSPLCRQRRRLGVTRSTSTASSLSVGARQTRLSTLRVPFTTVYLQRHQRTIREKETEK